MSSQLRRKQNKNIAGILGRRDRGAGNTDATTEELMSDADLAAIPENAVDDGTTPILGQYREGQGADYSQTEEFRATPESRSAEGPTGVTGNIISQGEAPDTAFAPEGDEFADAWWNKEEAEDLVQAPPTRESAAEKAMFDWEAPSEWGGAGGYNYRYEPSPTGELMGTIYATGPDGRTVAVTPATSGRDGKNPWAAILEERYRAGEQPVNDISPIEEREVPAEEGPAPGDQEFVGPVDAEPPPGISRAEAVKDTSMQGAEQFPEEADPLAYFDAGVSWEDWEGGAEAATDAPENTASLRSGRSGSKHLTGLEEPESLSLEEAYTQRGGLRDPAMARGRAQRAAELRAEADRLEASETEAYTQRGGL